MKIGQTGYVKVMDAWYRAKVYKVFSTSMNVILLERSKQGRVGDTVNCDFGEWKSD